MNARKSQLVGALLLLSSLPACSDRGDASVPRKVVDSSGGTVALGIGSARAYRATSPGSGAVHGTISTQGIVNDSTIAVAAKDAKTCGDSADLHETLTNGTSLANALVWVEGISSGKSLPDNRRETLAIEGCRFEPRMMAVVTKTTINVFSGDRVAHGPRFYREGGDEPIEHIQTVDAGQVVPSERVAAEPGIVEVRCKEHPWARAYIAVFDHPYFAISDKNGSFRMDSLPAGTYTVKVWHERLSRPVEQRVTVGPGGTGRVDVALQLGPTGDRPPSP